MNRFVVKQTGRKIVACTREFVLEVPSDVTKEQVDQILIDEFEPNEAIDWKPDWESVVELEEQTVFPCEGMASACESLPVIHPSIDFGTIHSCEHEFETVLVGQTLNVRCDTCGLYLSVDDPTSEELGEALISPFIWSDASRLVLGDSKLQ